MQRLRYLVFVGSFAIIAIVGCTGSSGPEGTHDAVAEVAEAYGEHVAMDASDLGLDQSDSPEIVADETSFDLDVPEPPADVVIEAPVAPGAFLITEFMADPDVSGGTNEWIEVYNTTDEWWALSGCTLRDEGGESTIIGDGVVVGPKCYAAVAHEGTNESSLGVPIAWLYSGFILEDSGDEILLECRGALIDKVSFGPGEAKPLMARQLKPESYSYVANDDSSQWCDAVLPFGDGSAKGTPGKPNSLCLEPDPCEPNPCLSPPEAGCDSMNAVVLTFTSPGQCHAAGTLFGCDYAPGVEDCEAKGQVCKNAACVTVVDPCNPDPCVELPGDFCQPDMKTLVHYTGSGICSDVDGEASCDFTFFYEDCSENGKQCKAAQCIDIVVEAKPTNVGDVIVSEFMAEAGPEPDYGEWIELYNTTATALNMKTCALVDMSGQIHTFSGNLVIPPHDYIVMARSDVQTKNYGVVPDYVYSGFLLDNGADYIIIKCGNKKIDELYYQSGLIQEMHSTQLDATKLDYIQNDLATSWCKSLVPFGTAGRFGTPGTANLQCTIPVNPVDWCRLRYPDFQKVLPDGLVLYAGLIEEAGVTDLTPLMDQPGPIRAEAGYGPQESNPVDNPDWTWLTATGSPTWNGLTMGLPGADEYSLIAESTPLGFWDVAFRFSADEGVTWTYCDLLAGEGQDGSEDGYSSANAGKLFVMEVIDPCLPNPCTDPPWGSCEESGKWLIYYPSPGLCSSTGPESTPVCEYPSATLNCWLSGKVCVAGECLVVVP